MNSSLVTKAKEVMFSLMSVSWFVCLFVYYSKSYEPISHLDPGVNPGPFLPL